MWEAAARGSLRNGPNLLPLQTLLCGCACSTRRSLRCTPVGPERLRSLACLRLPCSLAPTQPAYSTPSCIPSLRAL
jgi:hypothetical protein